MIKALIKKKIQELPENIRSAVEKFDWSTEILHIARDNHIHMDDIETFRNETLLVIVGLTNANDYEKNLVAHMGISHEIAGNLVSDANQHIFRPLQKIAFTHQDDDENTEDELEHSDVSREFQDHGIELVDEFAPEPQPRNELQDLANNLFNEKDEFEEDKESDRTKEVKQYQPLKNIDYSEPIDERDLRGISGHRISTDILGIPNNKEKQSLSSLDQIKLQNLQISKNEFFDISPTKQENVKEDGDFLNHIAKE